MTTSLPDVHKTLATAGPSACFVIADEGDVAGLLPLVSCTDRIFALSQHSTEERWAQLIGCSEMATVITVPSEFPLLSRATMTELQVVLSQRITDEPPLVYFHWMVALPAPWFERLRPGLRAAGVRHIVPLELPRRKQRVGSRRLTL